jgi:uncharacterized protein
MPAVGPGPRAGHKWVTGGGLSNRESAQASPEGLVVSRASGLYERCAMAVTYDPAKRSRTRAERGLDFEDAALVFAGRTFTFEDVRQDYGEIRLVTVGVLAGRMVIVIWTPRDQDHHVFSMRKANAREQKRYAPLIR